VDLRASLVPVAFAVWDGARAERGGNKSLSGWKVLRLPGYPEDAAYAAELGWGRRPGELGDVARGKQLVTGLCTGCHVVGDRKLARPGIAPDLSDLGAIATPAYVRESIVDPSAVIVPGPNPARHQDRAAPPDGRGTFRPAEAFRWWRADPAGRQVSKMPPYASLPRADVDAMVAYLMTLGVPLPVVGSSR
jgi:complex iron-sulfur molybdoenzyme family reductase subunit gamma